MTWEFAPTFDAAHRAALESGKSLVYVCPPAGWTLVPLAARIAAGTQGGAEILVLAPDPADVADVAAALASVPALGLIHAVSGHARTARLLAAADVRTLVATPSDALALARGSALHLAKVRVLLLA